MAKSQATKKRKPNGKRTMRRQRGEALSDALAFVAAWSQAKGPSIADLAKHLGVTEQRAGRIVRELAKRRQLTVVAGEKWGDPVTLRVATP